MKDACLMDVTLTVPVVESFIFWLDSIPC
jgi:hypothetical protein